MVTASPIRLRRMRSTGPRAPLSTRASKALLSSSFAGGTSRECQMYLRLSNSMGFCLGDLTQFVFYPVHFYPEVVLGNAEDILHFLVCFVFEIEHGQRLFDFGEPSDRRIQQLKLLFLFRGVLDILQFGRQALRVHAGDQPPAPAEARDRRVERDTIEPGSDPRVAPEGRVGPPQLDNDLLEKVLAVRGGKAIQPAH